MEPALFSAHTPRVLVAAELREADRRLCQPLATLMEELILFALACQARAHALEQPGQLVLEPSVSVHRLVLPILQETLQLDGLPISILDEQGRNLRAVLLNEHVGRARQQPSQSRLVDPAACRVPLENCVQRGFRLRGQLPFRQPPTIGEQRRQLCLGFLSVVKVYKYSKVLFFDHRCWVPRGDACTVQGVQHACIDSVVDCQPAGRVPRILESLPLVFHTGVVKKRPLHLVVAAVAGGAAVAVVASCALPLWPRLLQHQLRAILDA
mmetsp:Transcript_42300/g.109065  ORF Transcript_42300/g.109065 Transcript_42300/m.109065 type:complete len:267 (-) Transcript_42300:732-1532(-)